MIDPVRQYIVFGRSHISPAKNGGNDGGSSVSGAISFSEKHMFDCLGFSFLEGLPAGPVVLVLIFFR